MRIYCTLSDKNYLKFGKAMIDSIQQSSSEDFLIYYLCLDNDTFLSLDSYKPFVIPVNLSEVEKAIPELENYKNRKSYREYCWSLASGFSYYLLTEVKSPDILYVDSDVYFYQDPKLIFEEIGDKSVGIIRHRHNTNLSPDGEYNVGVVYFKSDEDGLNTLKFWLDCVVSETHKEYATCGDQKYLELFNTVCKNLCVIDEKIAHGAPWNFRLYVYDFFKYDGSVIWGNKKQPLVFNHFSKFSINSNGSISPTGGHYADHTLSYKVFDIPTVRDFYIEYAKKVNEFL